MIIMTKFIQNSQQKIWDLIAPNWNNFRQKPLRELYKLNWKKGKILDLGCGNSRNLLPFKQLQCYGLDFSKNMLKESRKFSWISWKKDWPKVGIWLLYTHSFLPLFSAIAKAIKHKDICFLNEPTLNIVSTYSIIYGVLLNIKK